MRRRRALVPLGLSLAILTGCNPFDSSYTYSVDGWCLRHSGEDLELFDTAAFPKFLVPANFEQTRRGYEGKRALITTFHKGSSLATTAPERHLGRMGCELNPQPTGLSLLVGEQLPNCTANPRRDRQFVPTNPGPNERTVYVQCSAREMPNCQLAYILGHGWAASIIMPTRDLDRWDEAVRVTREYFHTYITDCGGD